jgi:putative glycosyltransferase (TIGR04372 family)
MLSQEKAHFPLYFVRKIAFFQKSALRALRFLTVVRLPMPIRSALDRSLTDYFKEVLVSFAPLAEIEARVALYELTRDESWLECLKESDRLISRFNKADFLLARNLLLGALRRLGSYSEASRLSVRLKIELDLRENRLPGLYGESAYFSAMGHLCLLHYMLCAIEANICDSSRIVLIRSEYPVANVPFADWLERRARKLGVKVMEYQDYPLQTEPDLELWPQANGYIDSHQNHGAALGLSKNINDLLDPQIIEDISKGQEILGSHYLDIEAPTVGFHIRNNQQHSRSLRNSSPQKYAEAMEVLTGEGYQVVVLGELSPRDARAFPSAAIQVTNILGKVDAARANVAVWFGCEFFVGNLSGGTNPAGVFGRPVLWVDQYPLRQWRVAGPMDLFLPKLAFGLEQQRFLSLRELLGEEHRLSQTEDPALLARAGFSLRPIAAEEIVAAVQEMRVRARSSKDGLSYQQELVASIYAGNGFEHGGHIPQSFLELWGETLLAR